MKTARLYRYFIGIDVSKNELDFAVIEANQVLFHLEVSNNKKGIQLFIKQLKSQTKATVGNCLFCMEHTGIYCTPLLDYLFSKKANTWVENAAQIRESTGVSRTKNDKADAIKIASYAYKNSEDARLWQPKREVILQLDRLTALRNRLVTAIGMLKKPLKELALFISKKEVKTTKDCCQASLLALKKDLKLVDAQIKQVIESDLELKQLCKVISSVKGISTTIVTEIIITTNEFKDINNPKKYACYAGVAPFEHSSGKWRGKAKVSRIANKKVKTLLHMAALVCIQHCQQTRAYYDRKVGEGKNKMLIINNIRNKIVLRIFACVNANRLFEKDFPRTAMVLA